MTEKRLSYDDELVAYMLYTAGLYSLKLLRVSVFTKACTYFAGK